MRNILSSLPSPYHMLDTGSDQYIAVEKTDYRTGEESLSRVEHRWVPEFDNSYFDTANI